MVIDTSAIYAIVASEPERSAFIEAIVSDAVRLCIRGNAAGSINHRECTDAGWLRFGKARAPAGLNLGEELLFEGSDFSKTDIGPVLR
jgi:uncharacterized protein with PIN domain